MDSRVTGHACRCGARSFPLTPWRSRRSRRKFGKRSPFCCDVPALARLSVGTPVHLPHQLPGSLGFAQQVEHVGRFAALRVGAFAGQQLCGVGAACRCRADVLATYGKLGNQPKQGLGVHAVADALHRGRKRLHGLGQALFGPFQRQRLAQLRQIAFLSFSFMPQQISFGAGYARYTPKGWCT